MPRRLAEGSAATGLVILFYPMRRIPKITLAAAALLASGCATLPEGPNILALPGTGKGFDQFQSDDAACRAYAYEQVAHSPRQRRGRRSSPARGAAVGAVAGGILGAAVDGHHGAAVGAGTGLVAGSLAGGQTGETAAERRQEAYDIRYIQCMYARGHRVPVAGVFTGQSDRPPPTPPRPPGGNARPEPAPATSGGDVAPQP